MELFISIVILAIAVVLFISLFIVYQGTEKVAFLVDQRTPFRLRWLRVDRVVLTCDIPVGNLTSQDGTIMDAFPRYLLPFEQYDAVSVDARLTMADAPRSDGYWEAFILSANTQKTTVLTVTLVANGGDIVAALADMPDMPIDIYYQVVGRANWHINKSRLILSNEEIMGALKQCQKEAV